METIYFRAFAEIPPESEVGQPIRFVASTEGVARDGMIVRMNGLRLDNYRRNPVFLWAHDYRMPPIGRVEANVSGDQLLADVTFDQADPFARQVEDKYRRGFLNAVSIGWNTLKMTPGASRADAPEVTDADLLDISAVPVGSDPRALKERKRAALENYLTELETDDEPDDVGLSWSDVAIEMMRLFDPQAETTDKERRRSYNRLERAYRQAGKTAPEFLKLDELDGLEADEISGLFLEGETALLPGWMQPQPTERIGAVLSARNKADLLEAARLVNSVVERSQPAEETPPPPPERSVDLEKAQIILSTLTKKQGA